MSSGPPGFALRGLKYCDCLSDKRRLVHDAQVFHHFTASSGKLLTLAIEELFKVTDCDHPDRLLDHPVGCRGGSRYFKGFRGFLEIPEIQKIDRPKIP